MRVKDKEHLDRIFESAKIALNELKRRYEEEINKYYEGTFPQNILSFNKIAKNNLKRKAIPGRVKGGRITPHRLVYY